MAKEILCAIDFSDSSKDALRWSVSMARDLKFHLTVLHTYRLLQNHTGEAIAMKKKTETEAMKNLAVLEKELLKGQGVSYDIKSEIGFVSDRVKEYAKRNRLGLLVIGKHTNTSNVDSLNEVVDKIQVPLVIVP